MVDIYVRKTPEYVFSRCLAVGPINVPASNVIGDLLSFPCDAGIYKVDAVGEFNLGTGVGITRCLIGVSTVAGNSASGWVSGDNIALLPLSPTAVDPLTLVLPGVYVPLAAPGTIYLKMQCTYTGGQPTLYGRLTVERKGSFLP